MVFFTKVISYICLYNIIWAFSYCEFGHACAVLARSASLHDCTMSMISMNISIHDTILICMVKFIILSYFIVCSCLWEVNLSFFLPNNFVLFTYRAALMSFKTGFYFENCSILWVIFQASIFKTGLFCSECSVRTSDHMAAQLVLCFSLIYH